MLAVPQKNYCDNHFIAITPTWNTFLKTVPALKNGFFSRTVEPKTMDTKFVDKSNSKKKVLCMFK